MTSSFQDRIDGIATSMAIKVPVRVATTANITLSGLQDIDGVTVVANDRVLVKDQSTGTENGIYKASSSAWTRAQDFDGARDLTQGTLVRVTQGSTLANTMWELTTSSPIVDTSSLTFARSDTALSDAELLALAGLTSVADSLPYFTGSGTASLITLVAESILRLGYTNAELLENVVDTVGADLASAATLPVNVAGRFHHVTGTTGITAFDDRHTGAYKELEFDGTLSLTHSSTLQLPRGENLAVTAGHRAGFRQEDDTPTWVCMWDTPSATSPLRPGYLSGLESTTSSTNTWAWVTAGSCNDSTDSVLMTLASTWQKDVDASWVAGSGNGGLSSSLTLTDGVWYHVFVVLIGGEVDVLLDTSPTCANGIADHSVTHYRRVYSAKANGTTQLHFLYQHGDFFQPKESSLAAAELDISTGGFYTLDVPYVDLVVNVLMRVNLDGTSHTGMSPGSIVGTIDNTNSVVKTTSGATNISSIVQMWVYDKRVWVGQDTTTGADSILRALSWWDRRGKRD